MAIPEDLRDALMKEYKNPEDLIGETGLLQQLTKQLQMFWAAQMNLIVNAVPNDW